MRFELPQPKVKISLDNDPNWLESEMAHLVLRVPGGWKCPWCDVAWTSITVVIWHMCFCDHQPLHCHEALNLDDEPHYIWFCKRCGGDPKRPTTPANYQEVTV